jgi:2-polyprenyl-3-methyl-5-hydroxy-6-metoxy-1,4-benzoquinol methylase
MADVITPIYTQSQREGIEAICPPNPRRILDIGGSSGRFAQAIKQSLGAQAVFVADYSADALAKAAEITDGTFQVDLNRRGAITEALSSTDPFDLVFCLCVLEHVYDPWALIAELHETLPMGATIVASVPNTQHLRFIARVVGGTWHYDHTGLFDRTHIRFFSRKSAEKLMTCSGLELVASQMRIRNRTLALFDKLTLGLFRRFLALQFEVVVRKTSDSVRDPGFCGANIAGA